MRRREFLKTAIGAGIAMTTGLGWAAQNEPILDLELVKREYARLYDYLKREKDKAGLIKDLVIVSGESHSASNSSVLQELMIADIAARFRINEFVTELPPGPLIEDGNNLKTTFNKIKSKSAAEVDEEFAQYDLDLRVLQILNGWPKKFPDKYTPETELEDKQTRATAAFFVAAHGMNFHGGDPIHELIHTPEQYEKREREMVKVIDQVKGSKLCNFGADHLSSLVKKLATNPNNHVVGLDISCNLPSYSFIGGKEKAFANKSVEHAQQLKRYLDFLDKRNEESKQFYSPRIPANPQLQPVQAFAMILLVSCEHKLQKGEMEQENYDIIKKAVLSVVKDIPGLGSGPKR